jgi:hypothetical protein
MNSQDHAQSVGFADAPTFRWMVMGEFVLRIFDRHVTAIIEIGEMELERILGMPTNVTL